MRQCIDIPKATARLKRIEGQIRGIAGMIEKDTPCDQILIQIGAAKAALHKLGQTILEGHLQHCVVDGIEHGDVDKVLKDLTNAIEQFSRIV
ncbi:MAG: metal-sensing transcriptional repressor [Spirochaetaceae bacterium]|nr:metal-sensing transcriptional repressor [Spirochaetaceae bacterium]